MDGTPNSAGLITVYRGSRKHILDWVARDGFCAELRNMVAEKGVVLASAPTAWMPNATDSAEARLDTNGKTLLPDPSIGDALDDWWLAYRKGANTPNWDLAAACVIEGRQGLLLVEAKANVPELDPNGKRRPEAGNPRSQANHNKIGAAIDEARAELDCLTPGILIARDTHYQLSNRVAFAWKLATCGVPVVLAYLGFTEDEGIRSVGEPLRDAAHWQEVFANYSKAVLPPGFVGRKLLCGKASLQLIVCSRCVLDFSAPRE